jgi:ABC-2 type transport system permease protein
MMKLFMLDMKRNIKSTLIWSLGLGLSLFFVIIIYPIVQDMMDAINHVIEQLESLEYSFLDFIDIFGGIPSNGIEYFATEGAMFMQIAAGMFASLLGFSIINRDDREKTAEMLYTLPITRSSYLLEKMIAVFVQILLFMLIQLGIIALGFSIVAPDENISALFIFGFFDGLMLVMIAFLSMGLSLVMKPGSSTLFPLIIPIPLYVITTIAYATDNHILRLLRFLSPFTFAEPVGFLKNQRDFEWLNFGIFGILTLIVIVLSFIAFKKREIV